MLFCSGGAWVVLPADRTPLRTTVIQSLSGEEEEEEEEEEEGFLPHCREEVVLSLRLRAPCRASGGLDFISF